MSGISLRKPILILILILITINHFGVSFTYDDDDGNAQGGRPCQGCCARGRGRGRGRGRRMGRGRQWARRRIGRDFADDVDDDVDGDDDDDTGLGIGGPGIGDNAGDGNIDMGGATDDDDDDGDEDKFWGRRGFVGDDDDDDDEESAKPEDVEDDEVEDAKLEQEFISVDQEVFSRVEKLLITGNYNMPYFTDFANTPEDLSNSSTKAMVTSSDVRCSRVGAYYLKHGGNAIDAAVASSLCLSVIEMGSTGLSGGGISLSYMNGRFKAIDFRPNNTNSIIIKRRIGRCQVGKAFKVPGMVMGLYKLWKEGGKLEWKTLFDIPILIAYQGFEVKPSLGRMIRISRRRIRRDRYLRQMFFIGRCIKKTGARIVNVRIARTLHEISKNYQNMYVGRIPQIIASKISKTHQQVIIKEIQQYETKIVETLDINVDGEQQMITTSQDTGGPLLSYTLNSVKEYKELHPEAFHADGTVDDSVYLKTFDSIGNAHCLTTHLTSGDPKKLMEDLFPQVNTTVIVTVVPEARRLLTEKCSSQNAFDEEEDEDDEDDMEYDEEEDIGGSVSLNVFDENGNGVSVQSGINTVFGGKYSFAALGMVGNPLSIVGTDKRKRCRRFRRKSIRAFYSPAIVIETQNRTIRGIFSGAGGRKIPSAVAQVMENHYYRRLSLEKSVTKFRMFAPFRNNRVFSEVERPIPRRIVRLLRSKRRVRVRRIPRIWSSAVSAISVKQDRIKNRRKVSGVADRRKNGGVCSA